MRDGPVVSEKMEVTSIPKLVCRDVKATKRRFGCVNGSTFSTAGAEIRIPISCNAVLDNKNINLNLKINATGVDTAKLGAEFSWASLFSQIRIEAGTGSSIILEQVDDPGLWSAFLYQYTWAQEDMSIPNEKQLSAIGQPSATDGYLTKVGSLLTATTAVPTQSVNIAIDLSQFMGIFNANTGLPLYNTAGITCVFVLNQQASMGVTATAAFSKIEVADIFITATCLD